MTNYSLSDGRRKIVVDKVVDKGDTTQMEAAASKGDKEDSTQAVMEVKEGREDSTQAVMEVKEGREVTIQVRVEVKEDIIQDKVEALEVKEVTIQEVVATTVDKGDKEGKEATTLVTMDRGAMVAKVDKEDIIQMGMATKGEAREVTIQEEVVTMMEKGEMVTIQADLGMRRGILEKILIGRLSAQLSEVHYSVVLGLNFCNSF